MPYLTFRYFSDALQKHTQAEVILPDLKLEGPFHVMFLLHGLSDDSTVWMRKTSIERYLEGVPLIVVMPDGGRGWYCDALEGYAYETALGQELPKIVEQTFPTKGPWCVSGLSMGGYGAFKLALRYPERFHSAVSHSGSLRFGHYKPEGNDPFMVEVRRIVGEDPTGGVNDLFALSGKMRPSKMPFLRFDCGVNDFLLPANREFREHLTRLEIEHEYEEFPGEHSWEYWDLHIREAIAFHKRHLHLP